MISPGFEFLDIGGPLSAFRLANDCFGAKYEVTLVSVDGAPVASISGPKVETAPASAAEHGDTIIVGGGPELARGGMDAATVALIRRLAPTTRRMASGCTGAFYLAEAGLLDGRRATTHWMFAPELQSGYPAVRIEADRIFVHDRGVWTSGGLTAGIDLALALIEDDFGSDVSKAVARALVVHYRRPGLQSQFSALLELESASVRIRDALAFAREHLHEALTVERLAGAANLSARQFARLFLQETGVTPGRAVERMRAELARTRIEQSPLPLDEIARSVGFGDAEAMRRAFVRLFGLSPQAVRRLARQDGG